MLKFVAYPLYSDVGAFRKKSLTSQKHNALTLTAKALREKNKINVPSQVQFWWQDCKDPETGATTCEMNSPFHTSPGCITHKQSEPKKHRGCDARSQLL